MSEVGLTTDRHSSELSFCFCLCLPCLRNTASFIILRYRKSCCTSHYTTVLVCLVLKKIFSCISTHQRQILPITGFIPSCGCINTTVWMHHIDTNKTHWEKVKWELHKNTTSYLEQILGATYHETAAVRPLASHLKNHPSKTNKICGTQLEEEG